MARTVSSYREFPAPSGLRSHVLCLWTQCIGGPTGEYTHRVWPDACIDMVFINRDAPIVVGPWTEPSVTRFLSPEGLLIGVTFTPWMRKEK